MLGASYRVIEQLRLCFEGVNRIKICDDCKIDLDIIKSHEKVIDLLGYWPCFHDGIFESLHFDPVDSGGGTHVHIGVRVHRMLKELTSKGYYKQVDHCRIVFKFTTAYVFSLSMQMFPDILFDVCIRNDPPDRNNPENKNVLGELDVRFVGNGILDFRCDSVEVSVVEPISQNDD